MTAKPFRIATRSSPLALHQSELVAAMLRRAGLDRVELVPVETVGDRDETTPLSSFQARGVFTTGVDAYVLDGRADAAVHSAKDLPASIEDGLELVAIPERSDVRDALVGSRLEDLHPGAVIGTGAVRRRVQLAAHRPDLGFAELRGNIATRLERAIHHDAIVVALAALKRLDQTSRATETLPISVMLPQVGQGAIAVKCRADDEATSIMLGRIDDHIAHRGVQAERSFLRRIGGGCSAPVAAYGHCADLEAPIHLEAMIASLDGHVVLRRSASGTDPSTLGQSLADQLLIDDGGSALLAVAEGL